MKMEKRSDLIGHLWLDHLLHALRHHIVRPEKMRGCQPQAAQLDIHQLRLQLTCVHQPTNNEIQNNHLTL